ncbi:hypothetical protein [Paenibacillus nasutitermitis]|uniref:Glycosyl hydrolase family 32 N-terminal domain-containing protein n=1 Tax=Paenibacillus nasutitermitis TaxID=1652958 RepID=A0A916YN56_9BACL|nr:hypothetical protein [Paenibacillus nasutitermitis]GGD53355.1 hypothetical protein GCM10010911_08660 [Paenibacillus nasutitermitis]
MNKSEVEKYATPYKLGRPVLTGSGMKGRFDSLAVDVPFVFFHRGRFYMTYVGFDGDGYQTALAVSDNLLDWSFQGVILGREDSDRWDRIGAAGTWILKQSNDLYELPQLKKINDRYWMVYHSYPSPGYEEGAAEIGLAWCEDENLLEWHKLAEPVFTWKDGDDWEKGGLYKACLIEHEDKFYLFYNAKNLTHGAWAEQTGAAVSQNLLEWTRFDHNPILQISVRQWDSKFVSDPYICRDGDLWLNFYFGFDGVHAQEGLAFSADLLHWRKHDRPILESGYIGSLDEIHAHKASILYYNDVLYHFYTAVRPYQDGDRTGKELHSFRTITVATSKPVE